MPNRRQRSPTPNTERSSRGGFSIRNFNPTSNKNISAWFKLFNQKAENLNLDDTWKLHNIADYLEGEAFDFYLDTLIEEEDWEELQQKLTIQFKCYGSQPFLDFIHHTHKPGENIHTYFQQKVKLARKAHLTENQLMEGLNDGVESELKPLLVVAQPQTPEEWVETAIKLENCQKTANSETSFVTAWSNLPPQPLEVKTPGTPPAKQTDKNVRPPRQNYNSFRPNRQNFDSFRPPIQNFRRQSHHSTTRIPRTPCQICLSHGEELLHWHANCPRVVRTTRTTPTTSNRRSNQQPQNISTDETSDYS